MHWNQVLPQARVSVSLVCPPSGCFRMEIWNDLTGWLLAAGSVRAGNTWRSQDTARQVSTEHPVPSRSPPGPGTPLPALALPGSFREIPDAIW
jgi:hypothetical protein